MHALQEEADRIAEARAVEEQRKALEKRKRLETRMQAVSITNAVQCCSDTPKTMARLCGQTQRARCDE
eukprot:9142-Heterococcus_DN1.PRE.1